MTHIDEQQALVVVEHLSTQFNLYLSDLTGVYFALSLPDIAFRQASNGAVIFDLELVCDSRVMQ